MDEKFCEFCGRSMSYRKKWKKSWEDVKYCSQKCRRSNKKTLALYKEQILELLKKRDSGKSICPSEILPIEQKKDKDKMEVVRSAARQLARENKIQITQKNKPVHDLDHFKGPIRLILKPTDK